MNVSSILERGQGETHKRGATVDAEEVWLALHLFDEVPNDRGARLELTVHRVPDLDGARRHLSIEWVRDPMQRRSESLI